MCFGAGDMSRQLGKGRSRRVQEDWNTQFGGNGLRNEDPDLDERGFGNPRPGRVNFVLQVPVKHALIFPVGRVPV